MKLINKIDGIHAKLKERFNIYLLFALSDINIFSNYDQFIITCSCIKLAIQHSNDDSFYNKFIRVLSELNVEENTVSSCVSSIIKELQRDDSTKPILPSKKWT